MSKEQNKEFVRVASTAELLAGKMGKVNVGGNYCAINNVCPHAGASLTEGTDAQVRALLTEVNDGLKKKTGNCSVYCLPPMPQTRISSKTFGFKGKTMSAKTSLRTRLLPLLKSVSFNSCIISDLIPLSSRGTPPIHKSFRRAIAIDKTA